MPKEKPLRHQHRPSPLQVSPNYSSLQCNKTLGITSGAIPSPQSQAALTEMPSTESLSVKKILPSRSRQLETQPLKSAMRCPASPVPKAEKLMGDSSPPPPGSPTGLKSVRFYSSQPYRPTNCLHTTHYTYSPHDYDRSSIIADRSLGLPHFTREEANEANSSSTSDHTTEPNCCSLKAFDAFDLGSPLDGF